MHVAISNKSLRFRKGLAEKHRLLGLITLTWRLAAFGMVQGDGYRIFCAPRPFAKQWLQIMGLPAMCCEKIRGHFRNI